MGIRLSKSTINNRFRATGFKARRPFKGMHLTKADKMGTTSSWVGYSVNGDTMFSNESRFCLNLTDGQQRVWRRVGERYYPATVQQHNRYGVAVSWSGRTSRTTKGRN